jgi:23S rRNA (pseudouridine1915-N3)-methyltransferase
LKIKILVIGKLKEVQYKNKINQYLKWINIDYPIELVTLKERKEKVQIHTILKYLSSRDILICLSEDGIQYDSVKFSNFIHTSNRNLVFLIAGPDGHSKVIKNKSDQILSLSNFTFPHEMAILILAEQIFRAISIQKGSKYHRV